MLLGALNPHPKKVRLRFPNFMVDRVSRDQMIVALEAYLDDKLTAFELDNRFSEIETKDETAQEIIRSVWLHYDDCRDHKVQLSKPEWDYFQRLLLVLRSDSTFSFSQSRRWSWDHLIACLSLITFLGIALRVGWSGYLLGATVPFGIVSIFINLYRRRIEPVWEPLKMACFPFESVSQILPLRRNIAAFAKRKYRSEIGARKIRSDMAPFVLWAFSYGYWLVFSPLILFTQAFPSKTKNCSIRPKHE
jgi:hypothetical protein